MKAFRFSTCMGTVNQIVLLLVVVLVLVFETKPSDRGRGGERRRGRKAGSWKANRSPRRSNTGRLIPSAKRFWLFLRPANPARRAVAADKSPSLGQRGRRPDWRGGRW